MNHWIIRNRFLLFVGANAALDIAVVIMATQNGVALGQAVYAGLLFALCAAPILLLKTFNGRHALLLIFTLTYFMHFGAMDLQAALVGSATAATRAGFLTPAELAVLAGGVLLSLGYLAGLRAWQGSRQRSTGAEWPAGTMLFVGLAFWVVGTATMTYLSVFLAPVQGNHVQAQAFEYLGPVGTFAVELGHLVQPLGLLILAYAYARFRGAFWTTLIITVVILQAAAGFVMDVKSTAIMGVLVVVVTRLLVDDRPPALWIGVAMVSVLLAFPVYQAYRVEITGERGLNHLQALRQIGKVFEIAWAARDKDEHLRTEDRPPSFLERAYLKDNLEQVMAHVGVDVPYLGGSSLVGLPMAFVPRLLAPDKASVSIGQLYNRLIGHGADDVYISISHLGELYWNFGWAGVLFGMPLIGLIMGVVGAKANLERGPSLTNALILVVSIQTLCVGFEGELPLTYVVWLRSLAAIGLMHLVFARRATGTASQAGLSLPALAPPTPRFRNVMR